MKNLAVNLSASLSRFFKPSMLIMADYSTSSFRSPSQNSSFQGSGTQFKKFQRFIKKSPFIPVLIVAVIVIIIVVVGIGNSRRSEASSAQPAVAGSNAQQTTIAKPVATETINKTFQFPLQDAAGKTVSNINYEIQSAEFDNQIIIKGQMATAVAGKTFLVLNLKIDNSYDKAVQLNTRDYIRLIVDGNTSEKLAADIHNDPVDIEAISTKFTRLGFPIDSNAKSLTLEVGQIDGPKQSVQLNLK